MNLGIPCRKKNKRYHRICRICGRRLKTRRARLIGFGRKCAAKVPECIRTEKLEAHGQMRFSFSSS